DELAAIERFRAHATTNSGDTNAKAVAVTGSDAAANNAALLAGPHPSTLSSRASAAGRSAGAAAATAPRSARRAMPIAYRNRSAADAVVSQADPSGHPATFGGANGTWLKWPSRETA